MNMTYQRVSMYESVGVKNEIHQRVSTYESVSVIMRLIKEFRRMRV